MKESLPKFKDCFFCGHENPIGLNLTYFFEDNKVFASFTPDKLYGFSKNLVHMGILQGILFEAMAWTPSYILKQHMALIDMHTRILRPVPAIGLELCVEAEATKLDRWYSEVTGEIKDRENNVYLRAQGKFTVSPSKDAYIQEHFEV